MNAKIVKYEAFLNEKLKPDLKSLLEQRDKVRMTAPILGNAPYSLRYSDFRCTKR